MDECLAWLEGFGDNDVSLPHASLSSLFMLLRHLTDVVTPHENISGVPQFLFL